MREIKFRAWDGNSLHYGGFSIHAGGKVKNECFINKDILAVMQYTGLKDKNGVGIYEGDILRYVDKAQIETLTGVVEYIEDGFHIREKGDRWHPVGGICSDENHEGSHVGFVIGNIHQNPELLENSYET